MLAAVRVWRRGIYYFGTVRVIDVYILLYGRARVYFFLEHPGII